MITESILTCPQCSHKKPEEMYENVFPTKFSCENCKHIVKIEKGECCIYCKFSDSPCLNAQIVGSSCCTG